MLTALECLLVSCFLAQEPASGLQAQAESELSVEDEVLGNIKRQPVGSATIEDFALPDEFLRRFADRVIRSSYEERYRIVVHSPDPTQPSEDPERSAIGENVQPARSVTSTPKAIAAPAASESPSESRVTWIKWSFPLVVVLIWAIAAIIRRGRSEKG